MWIFCYAQPHYWKIKHVCVGQNAGYSHTEGDENVCVGQSAGYNINQQDITILLLVDKAGTTILNWTSFYNTAVGK